MKIRHLALAATFATALALPAFTTAQERVAPLADVLSIDAAVTSEVAPDLAVVTMAIVRDGPEVPPLTKDVNEALAKAFADAKAVPTVTAANGGYSTSPRFETRGGASTRTGWQVRGEVVLKSKDFNALGALVGRLSQALQITGSGFEMSPDLRAREGTALIDRGVRAFQEKAGVASKAFGYSGWSIREVNVGSAGDNGGGRPMMRMEMNAMSAKSPAPLPVESGRVTLTLTVSGSVVMQK